MTELIMCRGLPASGKTTWAKGIVSGHPSAGRYVRINKDDLRKMLHTGEWSRDKEDVTVAVQDAAIFSALNLGTNVIVDDTNFGRERERHLRLIAMTTGSNFKIVDFDTGVDECIRRDALRPPAERVGEQVIRSIKERDSR